MPGLEVWGNKNSTCTQRILFTAAELNNAPFKFNSIDFATGQHKSPEFIKRQPFGKVPAAEWDGVPFFESRAICRILAEAHNDAAPLLPTDLKQKALFEQWASLESNTISPQMDPILYELVFGVFRGLTPNQAVADAAREKMTTTLEVLNTQLGKHEYIAGQFSLVDIFLTPSWQHLQSTTTGKEILTTYPNIGAWWRRVSSRPAWKKVLAEKDA